jgi:hypothetical protein
MKFSEIKPNVVYTFKLNSGEELIAKVTEVLLDENALVINEPVSIAPGPKGMGLVPSLFTSNPKASARLNTNSVALIAETEDQVRDKYREATTGISVPDKKLILG